MDNLQNGTTGQAEEGWSGAMGTRVTMDDFRWWLGAAQPGARLRYFTGIAAAEGSAALNEALRAEAERGMVFLVQQRRPRYGFDYLAIRSSRAIDGSKPGKVPGLREQVEAAFGRKDR